MGRLAELRNRICTCLLPGSMTSPASCTLTLPTHGAVGTTLGRIPPMVAEMPVHIPKLEFLLHDAG